MQNETKKELHTQMWKIENPKDFTAHDREVLEKAAAIIRAGGLVAFPTETVYGLGAGIQISFYHICPGGSEEDLCGEGTPI